MPPRGDKPVVLYLHGNGGALAHRADRFRAITADGTGLVALSYRGYGGSTGSPTEAGLITDAETAYAFTAARYPADRIVLWGESLGTGVAIALAAEKPVGRIILQSPFTSTADIGAARYWYVPVRLLMKDQFHSDLRIGKVTAPVLVMHGDADRVVPIAFRRAPLRDDQGAEEVRAVSGRRPSRSQRAWCERGSQGIHRRQTNGRVIATRPRAVWPGASPPGVSRPCAWPPAGVLSPAARAACWRALRPAPATRASPT